MDQPKSSKPILWEGRKVVSPAHVDNLERDAALLEFEQGLPRKAAEQRAYDDYLHSHHSIAAAHHLRGLRAAQASGDMDEARRHGIAYGLHLNKLGLDPLDAVPEHISELVDADDRKTQVKFKAHKADSLLLDEGQ